MTSSNFKISLKYYSRLYLLFSIKIELSFVEPNHFLVGNYANYVFKFYSSNATYIIFFIYRYLMKRGIIKIIFYQLICYANEKI